MERARRLAAFWSWLPAFRAVAESEHLPTASKTLNVTASSLSRTIRLLEDEIGMALFERTGRNIRLNETGAAFLQATRSAMRVVHEALLVATGDEMRGAIHCWAPSPFTPIYLIPATRWLAERYPDLRVHIRAHQGPDLAARLRRGELDLALVDAPIEDETLEVTRLCSLPHDVYVAKADTALEDVVFVAPSMDERGTTLDAWPPDRRRTIGLRTDLMQVAIDVVRSGAPYGAVLPVAVGEANDLVGLGLTSEVQTTTMFMIRRRPLPVPTRADVLADAILATMPPS